MRVMVPILLTIILGASNKSTSRLITPPAWKMITVDASGYCKNACCCGKYADGITASGAPARGKLIAAPKTYPYGTLMLIPNYGAAYVLDRGGAIRVAGRSCPVTGKMIKHDRIDLLFDNHSDALKFGRKTLTVWLLSPPEASG